MQANQADPAQWDPPESGVEPTKAEHIVLYDGVCGLCDHFIQFLLRIDREQRLLFAPLQGSTAATFAQQGVVEAEVDSVVYIVRREGLDTDAWVRSDAVLRIFTDLGRPWAALGLLRWMPRTIRDLVYRAVARSRYRIFGRFDACKLPTPEIRARFLD